MADDKNPVDPADSFAPVVMGSGAPAEPAPVASAIEPNGDDQSPGSVTWTASEFVAHDKSAGWYARLAICAVLLAAVIFLLTRDPVSVTVVIIGGVLLGYYGSHQPRQLKYMVDNRGIQIDQKRHDYDEFKSFSVAPEGAFSSIVFMPLKRFAVPLTVYYAPDDEESIVGILSGQLPLEEHRPDAVERLMKRIRF